MRKTLGISIVVLCFLLAGIFGAVNVGIGEAKQASAFMLGGGNPVPATLHTQFQLFTDTHGIFILREDSETLDDNDVFSSSISLTAHSGVNSLGEPVTTLFPTSSWRYEAVLADSQGVWHPTELLQLRVHLSRTSVTYWLPRAAPAGRYGIRVTSHVNTIVNGVPTVAPANVTAVHPTTGVTAEYRVTSVFVIQYSEELNRIDCADLQTGSMSYRVTPQSRTISVGVFVNPGAVRTEGLDTDDAGNFQVGNLDHDTGTSPSSLLVSNLRLHWVIENAVGVELGEHIEKPRVEAVGGSLRITLPTDTLGNITLPRGNFVIRVFHDAGDDISGTFIIENGGRYVNRGNNNGGAIAMLVLGIVFALGFTAMLVTPKVITRMQQGQYDASERQRYKKQMGLGELTADYAGSTKRVMDPKDFEKLTDAEKEELFKKRAAEAKETKGSKYLNKMAENKAKREFAREAGLTMQEYNELEEKARSMENSKEASLSAFRKAMEDKTGVITKQQEAEVEEANKVKEMRPQRTEGEPEFDMLDSEKGRGEVPEEYKEKPKVAEGEHWKTALKEADKSEAPKTGYGGFEEEIARLERMEQSGNFDAPVAPQEGGWKQAIVDLEANSAGVKSTVGGDTASAGGGHFVDIDKPDSKREEKVEETVFEQKPEPEPEPAPWLKPEVETAPEPQPEPEFVPEPEPETVSAPEPEHTAEPAPAPAPAPEEKKEEGGGSILSRLRRLTGEDE